MKRSKNKISNTTFFGSIVSALIVSSIFITIAFFQNKSENNIVTFLPIPSPHVDHFANISISAKAAIVYDVKENKILYQKNATTSLPLASITKVMTALVANNVIPKGNTVSIDKSSLDIEGESGFTEGQKWKFADLLNYTLLISSNDGAHAIANAASAIAGIDFPQKMDDTAKDLGLNSMKFNNESGLDDDNEMIAGGYGSALDVAKLFSYIVTKDSGLLEITKNDSWNFKSEDNVLYSANNTDLAVNKIPGLLASKTGYTDLAGGNLAIAFDAGLNHPIVVVVLGSTWDGRFDDILSLASTTLKSL